MPAGPGWTPPPAAAHTSAPAAPSVRRLAREIGVDVTQVTGTGYHDHNWGNRQMSSGLDHWYWGRAHIGDYTVVYAMLTSRGLFGAGQINLPTVMLASSTALPPRLTGAESRNLAMSPRLAMSACS